MPSYILSFSYSKFKNKMAAKLVKMSQLYIMDWLTMNIKTSFRCIKTHLNNILKVPWISPCAFPARGQNPKWPPLQHFGVLKPTWTTYLKSPEFHLVRFPLEDKIQNGRHCKAMCYNIASKYRRDVFLVSTYRFLTLGKPIQSRDNIYYQYFTKLLEKNKRKTTHRRPV